MTTTYGTIPNAGEELVISHAKPDPQQAMSAALAARRPWKEMFRPHAFSVPSAATDALLRLRSNLPYFRTNYAIAVLLLVFLGLLWRPVSLVVLVAMLAAWLFLYFLRDEPLVVMGRAVDDVAVLVALSSVTLLALFMTDVTVNLVGSLLVGAAAVVTHAALRRTDDPVGDHEAGGVYSAAPSAAAAESDGASTSAAP